MNPALALKNLLNFHIHENLPTNYNHTADLAQGFALAHELDVFFTADAQEEKVFEPFYEKLSYVKTTLIDIAAGNIPNHSDEALQYLAMLDVTLRQYDKLTIKDNADEVRALLKEFTDLIHDDPDIPTDMLEYCRITIAKIEEQLRDFEEKQAFDLQDAIDKMVSATIYLAESYLNKESTKYAKIGEIFIKACNMGTWYVTGKAVIIDASAALDAITS